MSASSPPSGWLATSFGLRGPVSRGTYAVTGVGLMVLKYLVEAALFGATARHFYTPLEFASPLLTQRQSAFAAAPQWVTWFVILWSVPFVWIAVSMSVRRAYAAGVTPWLGIGVLLPVINFPLMLLLAALPDRRVEDAATAERLADGRQAVQRRRESQLAEQTWWSTWIAISAGVLFLGASLGLCVYVIGEYGAVLFFASPFMAGAITGFLANRPYDRGLGRTFGVVTGMLACAALGLLLFALEGAICILMAVPIIAPLSLAGGAVGYGISLIDTARLREGFPCLALVPLAAWSEEAARMPQTLSVTSSIVVAAPRDEVWQQVLAFPPLDPPEEWYFRAGIACPMSSRIDGTGMGAVRHCVFTTGEFVEPITAWDPPSRLAFDVTQQPEPMFELTPYHHIHPPHLDGTFRSTRGEFRLTDLGDGTTRLEGTTWYVVEMGPQQYWRLWTDALIHRIHLRVLQHIRKQCETAVTAA